MDGDGPAPVSKEKACEVPRYLQGKSAEFQAQADAVLEVQGKAFPVHRQLLAGASPFFEELFLGVGNGDDGSGHYVLVPEGTNHPLSVSNFELFLDIVYRGALADLSILPPTLAEDLLPIADFLGEEPLVQSANLRKYLGLASQYRSRELMARCLPYLVEDIFINKRLEVIEDACGDVTVMKVVFKAMSTVTSLKACSSSEPLFARSSNTAAFKYEAFYQSLSESKWGKEA
ncbi:hypothetical protein N2152v2_009456 [Parachlorella kessleri]